LAEILKSLGALNVKVAVAECVTEPLVPVTVRLYVFARVAKHDTVAEPLPVTPFGVIEPHVSPNGTVSVNETAPPNPLRAVMAIVEIAD
jgi:hypothetical protein